MAAPNSTLNLLKGLIWLYVVLLLVEGALRKWLMPGWSNALLIVRDPVVFAIYFLALANGRFPLNGFVVATLFLVLATFAAGLLSPYSNATVTLIGLRCYFLHLPLIFVIERTFDQEDVLRVGKMLFWAALPMTALIVWQFYSPQGSWANLQVGGDVGPGLTGARGRFRPSGTFSFVVGVSAFYPLVLALLLGYLLNRRRLPLYLTVAALACVVIAIPFSISRTNLLGCALVLLAAAVALGSIPKSPVLVARVALIVGLVAILVSVMEFYDEGVETFKDRWVSSTGESQGGFQGAIIGRYLNDLFPSGALFMQTPILGYGIGLGTNMAQGYLFGQRVFLLGEGEWGRLIQEMGPILGLAFIFLRVALCGSLLIGAFTALRRGRLLPLLLAPQAITLTLNSQWSQPTIMGFTVLAAGFCFAAMRQPATEAASKPARRTRPAWPNSRPAWPVATPPKGRRPAAASSL